MTTYDFHPFVEPTNVGKITLPDFNTIMEREDVVMSSVAPAAAPPVVSSAGPAPAPPTPVAETKSIDDLNIDFSKLEISRGRQTKNSTGYTHQELKELGKQLKRRGFTVDLKSKDSLIDSIGLLK